MKEQNLNTLRWKEALIPIAILIFIIGLYFTAKSQPLPSSSDSLDKPNVETSAVKPEATSEVEF